MRMSDNDLLLGRKQVFCCGCCMAFLG